MKKYISSVVFSVLLFCCNTVYAQNLPDLSGLMNLFGDIASASFHFDDFSFENIDFDAILHFMDQGGVNFSELNYDALLDLIFEDGTLTGLGIDHINGEALNTWLKDPSLGKWLNEQMLSVQNGGSISESMKLLREDPVFLETFRALTGGCDYVAFVDNLDSIQLAGFMNRASIALLSPKNGAPSENALLMKNLVQSASDALNNE